MGKISIPARRSGVVWFSPWVIVVCIPSSLSVDAFRPTIARRAGAWRLLEASGWPGNQSCANLAAWSWEHGGNRHLVVVNLSGQPAQARVPLDWPDLPGRSCQLTDILGPSVFERDGGELASHGLFVDLGPWQFHLLAVQ